VRYAIAALESDSQATQESAVPKRPRALALIFFLLLLGGILLTPIWLVRYPPLLDYPNHLASAFVLAHLHDPGFRFDQFYQAHWGFYPYQTMTLTLIGLERFLPIELAGRLFMSLCVVAVPLAAWFFVRQANPGSEPLAFWWLPVSYNLFFLYGFLNMLLSMALCLLAVGFWLRYLARPSVIRWCVVFVVLMAVYFTHLLSFGIAGLLITAYSLLTRRPLRDIALGCLLFVPGTCLFPFSRLAMGKGSQVLFRTFSDKINALSAVTDGYSLRLDRLTLLALAGCAIVAWWRNPDFKWNRPWLILAGGLFALYWMFPLSSRGLGWPADTRLLPFLFLLLLVVAKVGRRAWLLAGVALVFFGLRTADVAYHFVLDQRELSSLARSFSKTSANARVLPILEPKDLEYHRWRYVHFWAYGVIERGWFSPYLFAEEGVHTLQIRSQAYHPDGFRYVQSPDWKLVQRDYDYVWAYNVKRFSSELAAIGQLVYQEGDLEVFQLNRP
jgi:hypothetical protein